MKRKYRYWHSKQTDSMDKTRCIIVEALLNGFLIGYVQSKYHISVHANVILLYINPALIQTLYYSILNNYPSLITIIT